jgi:hypothetical protein
MKPRASRKKTTPRREPHQKKKPKPTAKRSPKLSPELALVELPDVAGKIVDELLVASSSDDAGIDLFFDDQSGVSFGFVAELKMKVRQNDGRKDIWRPVRRWSKPRPH